MKQRCYNPNAHQFGDYGGRGIIVSDKWRYDFIAFINDMGKKPSSSYSIDRINNDGDYEPGNCRWATRQQQLSNRRKPDYYQGILKERYLGLKSGIYYRTKMKAWVAAVQQNGKQVVLGQSVDRAKAEKILIDYASSL